jgi:hypothetical protein
MSNLPARSDSESNEHLLRHSLGIVDEDSFEEVATETIDGQQIVDHLLSDPSVTQFATRRNGDSVDSMTGYYRCKFEPSQERAVLHVPIHPPMAHVPEVEATFAEPVDSFRIRVTDHQKFGARLEIIRATGLDQPASVMVEVILTAADEQSVE